MLITTDEQLREFCARAQRSEVLAIDTEFLREKTYRARLCLVQLGTDDEQVAVQPPAVLEHDDEGNTVVGTDDRVIMIDTSGAMVVPNSSRTVALLGMRDVVVVDTPDALLVCPRDRAQEVKSLVEALKNKGAGNLC